LEALVGRGGMATVYRAHDTVLNRSVAIKVLEQSLTVDPKAVERFRREAVTAANLEHPSIVRVYDVQQQGNIHFITMRFVQGTTLRDILRDNGSLPLPAALNIIKPVAAALHYAHRNGVIHRDVKPGNILVEPDGTVLLTDFGIARAMDNAQASLTAVGLVMGTADYLAPEQIAGRPAEARSDLYSLGVVLYEILTGVTPFGGENTAAILYRQVHDQPSPVRSINPRLPAEMQPIIDRALAKNPSSRYADPLDLARDLEELVRWMPPGSHSMGHRPPPPRPKVSQNGAGYKPPPTPPPPLQLRPTADSVAGVHTSVGVRQATGPQNGPRSYPMEAQELAVPQVGRAVIIPPARSKGSRAVLPLVALLMLALGGVVLILASGVLSKGGAPSGPARFEPPGPSTYTGLTRPLANGSNISIPRAIVAPDIDGDLSDWADAQPGPFPALYLDKGRPAPAADDLSAQFYFAWDAESFYIGAIVTDDIHVQSTATRGYDLFKGDDIEIWFDTDLGGDFTRNEGNADDFQLQLSAGDFASLGPEAVFWRPDKSDARNKLVDVKAQRRPDGKGYTLEARMLWTAFGTFRPQPGTPIGFAASVGDNDQRGQQVQEVLLSTVKALEWNKPFTFGNLFF
jgi:serine/threonine protein kinase